MSTAVASYTTLVGRCPVLRASSGVPAASRSWRPARAAASPATYVAVKCRLLSVTCALPEKQRPAFSIPPTALLYPIQPPDAKEWWNIKEEENHVKLSFKVPGLSREDFEITAGEDVLEIKRKEGKTRLLMTKEYDSNNVSAELNSGMLEVTVGRSKERAVKQVGIRARPNGSGQAAASTAPGTQDDVAGQNTTQDQPAQNKPTQ